MGNSRGITESDEIIFICQTTHLPIIVPMRLLEDIWPGDIESIEEREYLEEAEMENDGLAEKYFAFKNHEYEDFFDEYEGSKLDIYSDLGNPGKEKLTDIAELIIHKQDEFISILEAFISRKKFLLERELCKPFEIPHERECFLMNFNIYNTGTYYVITGDPFYGYSYFGFISGTSKFEVKWSPCNGLEEEEIPLGGPVDNLFLLNPALTLNQYPC